ncbi:MAG: hypothetical protein ACYDBJ_29190 [Aggregatilineales bacterium]
MIDKSTGKMILLPSALGKDLAGIENTRTQLWGASIMIELGLKLLPLLKDSLVKAQGSDLLLLENEIHIIRANLDKIVFTTKYDKDTIWQRTQNFLDAIQQAREVKGGVIIW